MHELLKLSNEKSDYTEQDIVERKESIIEGFLQYLKDNRFEEELCFSHGDTSLPNIFSLNCKFDVFLLKIK